MHLNRVLQRIVASILAQSSRTVEHHPIWGGFGMVSRTHSLHISSLCRSTLANPKNAPAPALAHAVKPPFWSGEFQVSFANPPDVAQEQTENPGEEARENEANQRHCQPVHSSNSGFDAAIHVGHPPGVHADRAN